MPGCTAIQLANADFLSSAVGYIPPVRPECALGAFLLGGAGLASSPVPNLIVGSAAGTPGGLPVMQPTYESFVKAASYLLTGVTEFLNMTFMVVARAPAGVTTSGQAVSLISDYGGASLSTAAAFDLGIVSTGLHGYVAAGGAAQVKDLTLIAGDVTVFQLYAATFTSGVGFTLENLTRGSSTTQAFAGAIVADKSRILQIGSSVGGAGGGTGQVDVAWAQVWGGDTGSVGALTPAERQAQAGNIRAIMAKRGITV